MKYCLKCGAIYADSYDEYERETCRNCGMILTLDENTTEEQFLQMTDSEKDAYEDNILSMCKRSEFFSEKSFKYHCANKDEFYYEYFRFDKYEELTGEKAHTKENELYYKMKYRKELSEAVPQYYQNQALSANVPKCPTCQSTAVEKISLTSKVVGGALFGLFSSNVRKTMHCKNCGYKW